MRKLKAVTALPLILLAASCATLGSGSSGSTQTATPAGWTDSVLKSMTLREKAAQIV